MEIIALKSGEVQESPYNLPPPKKKLMRALSWKYYILFSFTQHVGKY